MAAGHDQNLEQALRRRGLWTSRATGLLLVLLHFSAADLSYHAAGVSSDAAGTGSVDRDAQQSSPSGSLHAAQQHLQGDSRTTARRFTQLQHSRHSLGVVLRYGGDHLLAQP